MSRVSGSADVSGRCTVGRSVRGGRPAAAMSPVAGPAVPAGTSVSPFPTATARAAAPPRPRRLGSRFVRSRMTPVNPSPAGPRLAAGRAVHGEGGRPRQGERDHRLRGAGPVPLTAVGEDPRGAAAPAFTGATGDGCADGSAPAAGVCFRTTSRVPLCSVPSQATVTSYVPAVSVDRTRASPARPSPMGVRRASDTSAGDCATASRASHPVTPRAMSAPGAGAAGTTRTPPPSAAYAAQAAGPNAVTARTPAQRASRRLPIVNLQTLWRVPARSAPAPSYARHWAGRVNGVCWNGGTEIHGAQTRSTMSAMESTTSDGRYGKFSTCSGRVSPVSTRYVFISLDAREHVGVHPVADHRTALRVRPDGVQSGAHHQRVRLAREVGLLAGRLGDERGHRARRRERALGGGAGLVGVGADEPGPGVDQPHRLGHRLERVRAGLAEDHVVGVVVGEDVADVVQRGGQTGLADDVRRPAGPLVVEELGVARADVQMFSIGTSSPIRRSRACRSRGV